ncbi:MAG TPA: polyprenyl synthetase family protein [Candidatus Baltobacteraceae bacterium]|nr:polyprenyl synthetase family protein [Candidatus Baltobacteraceae bacterium]
MTTVSKPQPPLGEHRANVREYLRRIDLPFESVAGTIVRERLATEDDEDLLRSSLVLWACAACGGDLRDALPVAASFHLFDRFVRLHDELVDGSVEHWGMGQSLNAGDALYALAFRTLAEGVVDAKRRLSVAGLVARAVLESIEGRNVDIERSESDGLFPQLRSVRRRVAGLTGAALGSGATLAGANERTVRGFIRAGYLLAVASTVDDPKLARRVGAKAAEAIARCGVEPEYRAGFTDVILSVVP